MTAIIDLNLWICLNNCNWITMPAEADRFWNTLYTFIFHFCQLSLAAKSLWEEKTMRPLFHFSFTGYGISVLLLLLLTPFTKKSSYHGNKLPAPAAWTRKWMSDHWPWQHDAYESYIFQSYSLNLPKQAALSQICCCGVIKDEASSWLPPKAAVLTSWSYIQYLR